MTDRYCNVCGRDCKDKEFWDLDGADYCSRFCYDSAQPDPPEDRS
jgi:hypothetical protein